MGKAGKKLIAAAKEAVAVAQGEQPATRITIKGHAYVPESEIAAERERCANLVPTNWCDPLLTGPDAVKLPLDQRGVEKLLLGVQKRIRAADNQ